MSMTHPTSNLRRLLPALASLVLASAGSLALADGPGADQDPSYNLYTAYAQPSTAMLRKSKRSATDGSIVVKDVAPPSGYTIGTSD